MVAMRSLGHRASWAICILDSGRPIFAYIIVPTDNTTHASGIPNVIKLWGSERYYADAVGGIYVFI